MHYSLAIAFPALIDADQISADPIENFRILN